MKDHLELQEIARACAASVYCTIVQDQELAEARGLVIRALEALAVAAGGSPFIAEFELYHREWFNGRGWPDPKTDPFHGVKDQTH